jgi:alpha-N-arabinofuranosidase
MCAGIVLVVSILLGTAGCLNGADIIWAQTDKTVAPQAELVKNGGFEAAGAGLPGDWEQDLAQTGDKGRVSRDASRARSGEASLKLEPNSRNGGQFPLAIRQIIPAGAHRGKKVTISGALSSTNDTAAILGVLSLVKNAPSNPLMISHKGKADGWEVKSSPYSIPNDPSVQLVLFCAADGQSGAAWFDDLSIATEGVPPASTPVPNEAPQEPMTAAAKVDAGSVIRDIPAGLFGGMVEWRWNGNLIWDEAADRLDPRLVKMARDLGVTVLRYPGGTYSDYYHWKDGVGPRPKRPVVKHELGSADESRPNFGTDEVLDLAGQIGGEVMITVNAGTGTASEAADWVRYVKDKKPEVRLWEVGNELYIDGGSEFAKAITIGPEKYADRFLEFARAMRAADPDIRIAAIGGENFGKYAIVSYRDWNKTLLTKAAGEMDLLAVHNAYAPVVTDDRAPFEEVYAALFAAPTLIRRNLQTLEDQIRRYAPERAQHIKLAVTEWSPWFHVDWNNRYVDHNKTLGSALYVGSLFKAFLETPSLEVATFCHLNDLAGFGWIGTRDDAFPPRPDWAPTARYYALQMYSKHFGKRLVASTCSSPTFDSKALGYTEAVQGVPYVEVVSSLSEDANRLFIIGINKHATRAARTAISLEGFAPEATGTAWTLTGASMDANTGTKVLKVPGQKLARQVQAGDNPRFYMGGPGEITLDESKVTGVSEEFTYRVPARSIVSIMLTRKQH